MNWFRNSLRFLRNIIVISLLTLLLFEIAYRYQWIDFYQVEWSYHNEEIESKKPKTLLVFGDSFSAVKPNWTECFNADSSFYNVYNASIPGVGVEVHHLIAEDRIEETHPQTVIVQLYVGNDLYDIEKPLNWDAYSFQRNIYWWMANFFYSLRYVNYRLGQVSRDVVSNSNPKTDSIFKVEKYDAREKLFVKSELDFPAGTILLEGPHLSRFDQMLDLLNEMKERCGDVNFHVLVIPHCTQVSTIYRERFALMGSKNMDLDLAQNYWSEQLKTDGFSVIDPLEVFQKAEEKGVSIYYPNDPHLNQQGEELLGNFVFQFLKEHDSEN